MQTLSDKSGNTVAYLYNNVILFPDYSVGGVLLAHCVFTSSGCVSGKFFEGNLYNSEGEIIAIQGKNESVKITAEMGASIMLDAWKTLSLTKEHKCPWVNATENWAPVTLKEFLTQ